MTRAQQSAVVGVFADSTMAGKAVDDLMGAGFQDDQIRFSGHGHGTGTGGVLDRLKSLFTGQETTDANSADDFMGMGVPEQDAGYYQSEYEAGRSVVTVMAGDRRQEAYDILRNNGAFDVNNRMSQTTTSGYSDTSYAETQAPQTDYATTDYDTAGQKVRLHEEQLQAQKQQVQAGEVGIHKEVVTEEKTLNVPVSREEVYIERKPVSGTVPDNTPIGEEETYNIPVREEQVQVTKQPVVTEEIGIGKRVVRDNQQVTDTIRREEARIERTGDVNVADTAVDDTSPRSDQ